MSEKPEVSANAKQNKDHLWKKGQSGNPAGKKPGTRHKATMLADGDSTAMRLCIERLVPPRKDRPVSLDLPQMECVEDTIKAMAVISSGVADGELTPSEGQVLSGMVENYRKAIETTELEERISNLEKRKN